MLASSQGRTSLNNASKTTEFRNPPIRGREVESLSQKILNTNDKSCVIAHIAPQQRSGAT